VFGALLIGKTQKEERALSASMRNPKYAFKSEHSAMRRWKKGCELESIHSCSEMDVGKLNQYPTWNVQAYLSDVFRLRDGNVMDGSGVEEKTRTFNWREGLEAALSALVFKR
jgi:hypothetical protein